jgi:acetyl-CoA synthetase
MVAWSERILGVPIRDHYGQTELGMAIINGWHPDILRRVKPGSMGHPMPGWGAEVLLPDRDEVAPAGTPGRVVIDMAASPLMWFTAYGGAAARTSDRYSPDGRWYYTGDAGQRDKEGYFFFSARDDDVIIMAGYRIGPFEVESVMLEHPDVVEVAVVGVPDELRGEVIEAFVVLRPGVPPSDELATALQQHVKQRYAAHAYPRTVHFLPELPKTPSGKVQRFVLRRQRRA